MKNYRNIVVALIIVILFIVVSLLKKREDFQDASSTDDNSLGKIHEFMEKLIGMKNNINSKETNNEIKLRLAQLQQYIKLLNETKNSSSEDKIMNERNKQYIVLKCSPNTKEFVPVSDSKLTDNEEVTRKILSKIHEELDAIEKIHSFSSFPDDKLGSDAGADGSSSDSSS